jgi:uncharacterized protein (DUF488 family)
MTSAGLWGEERLATQERPLFTIGHSNHPTERFVALLARHRIEAVADVRSRPYSRFVPQYRKHALGEILAGEGIDYLFLGEQLGGKPPRGQVAPARPDYATRIRQPAFLDGIERLLVAAQEARTVLLCRERDPLECHRLHLICRYLGQESMDIRHILPDGSIEPQRDAERRLLARADAPLFADAGESETLQREYDRWWSEAR